MNLLFFFVKLLAGRCGVHHLLDIVTIFFSEMQENGFQQNLFGQAHSLRHELSKI